SGHTAAAFAMAATIHGEFARRDSSDARAAAIIAFTGACAVAGARVAQHVHWVSDLPLAAALGTWRGVVGPRRARGKRRADAALRGITVGLGPDQRMRVGWSSQNGSDTDARR